MGNDSGNKTQKLCTLGIELVHQHFLDEARLSSPPHTPTSPKMQNGGDYASNDVSIPVRPITVAIDPVALVITECITVTSAMRKHARWAHSSVSAILGGVAARPTLGDRTSDHSRGPSVSDINGDGEGLLAGRWGLRGKKGSSMQDNPLLSAFARLRSDLKSCKSKVLLRHWRLQWLREYRHSDIRHTSYPATLHAGDKIILHNCANHFSCPHCDHEDARL